MTGSGYRDLMITDLADSEAALREEAAVSDVVSRSVRNSLNTKHRGNSTPNNGRGSSKKTANCANRSCASMRGPHEYCPTRP
jgi:hypothetical protein